MTERSYDPAKEAAALLGYLRRLKDDRGAMANLRCALKPTQRHRAWPLLAAVGGIGQPIIETVAGLYAFHPETTDSGNLGDTCRGLSATHNSFEGRFRRLLACDREELCARIVPVVFAARAKGIPVNYIGLFCDLCYWGDTVKVRWAEAYWGGAVVATELVTQQEVHAS